MDPNQWRNFNSTYSSLSRLDTPIFTTEQSGMLCFCLLHIDCIMNYIVKYNTNQS